VILVEARRSEVTDLSSNCCLNCGAAEADVPLVQWRFQGRALWICADCLPIMIHKRHLLMEKWPSPGSPETSPSGER
jgi:hypothetical protein